MKKNLILGALFLGAASFSMLTGFDSAATAEDILQKYNEASKDIQEVCADADFNLDGSLSVPAADITMGINAAGTEKVEVTMDPFAMKATADITASVLGTETKVKSDVYGMMEEDGKFSIYMNATEGEESSGWQKTSMDGSEITKLLEESKNMQFDFSKLPVSFELDPEAVTVNGRECYSLSSTVSVNDLLLIAEPYMDQIPESGVSSEDIQMAGQLLSGLKINIALAVDAETYKPMQVHIDLDGSEWSAIGAMVGSMFGTDEEGKPYEVNLDVNAAEMDIVYDYETPVEIVLPAEAAAAEDIDVDSSSLLDMVENAEEAA